MKKIFLIVTMSCVLCPVAAAQKTFDKGMARTDIQHYVPATANSYGRFGSHFKTRVVVHNPTDYSYVISARLFKANGPDPNIVTFDIQPRQFLVWDNFLEEAFNYTGSGAVSLCSVCRADDEYDVRREFSVYAEVYNDTENGRYSTVVANGNGPSRISFNSDQFETVFHSGISNNENQRVNIGFMGIIVSGTVTATVRDANSNIVETLRFGNGWKQIRLESTVENGSVTWECDPDEEDSTCMGYPFVVVVDNRTNDGRYLQPIIYSNSD